MRYLFLPILALLAACQTAVPFQPVTDECGSINHLSKVGMKAEDIGPDTFPPGARVIHPGTMVTKDYRAERLNVHINAKGQVERLACG